MKIVNIDGVILHIFWSTWGNSTNFSEKMWLMITLVTKNLGFTLSLEDTFLEKPQGGPPESFKGYNKIRRLDWSWFGVKGKVSKFLIFYSSMGVEIYFKKCWRQEINDTSLKMSFNIDDVIPIKAMFMSLQIL